MTLQELQGVHELLRATDLALAGPVEQARANFDEMTAAMPEPEGITFESITWSSLPAMISGDAKHGRPDLGAGRPVLLYLHGGAFVVGSGHAYRSLWGPLAQGAGATGLAVDYRLAPEHTFPTAVDDGVAAYGALLDSGIDPSRVAIAGDSAGGGLTIAVAVAARDAGLPMPGALVTISPWADLAGEGASFTGKADEDLSLDGPDLNTLAGRYLDGADAHNPLASPIHADLTGLPPLLIQVGSAEILLDDAVRLAARAASDGVKVRLDVTPAMPHVWHLFAPMLSEAREAMATATAWLQEQLA